MAQLTLLILTMKDDSACSVVVNLPRHGNHSRMNASCRRHSLYGWNIGPAARHARKEGVAGIAGIAGIAGVQGGTSGVQGGARGMGAAQRVYHGCRAEAGRG